MPKDLKVLFVSNLFPDTAQPYRGLDNATLLHHLAAYCEIRAISPRAALPFAWRVPKPRPEDQNLAPLYVAARYVPKIGSRWNHRLMAGALREPLRKIKGAFAFDVVLCSWLYPDACAVAMLSEEMAFPFAAISQGSDAHQYLRMPVRRKAIVRALERSGRVITRSGELGRLLANAGVASEKLRTIYNGVDLELFQPGDKQAARRELSLPAEAPVILFVGNFYPVKDPLLLVRSHRILRGILPDCRLLMIGGGGLEARIRAEAAEGLELLGRRSSGEIARYMQAADVLCVPSQNEGVPNVILEAFATGLRVVATRVGGIPEVLADGDLGRLAPAGDKEAIAATLADALRHPCDVSKVRAHGSQFSWERAVSKYRDALEEASGRSVSAASA
jgi:glycosyltransferase involved in cell wall biosynthesis